LQYRPPRRALTWTAIACIVGATVAAAAILAACSMPSAPENGFTGTWRGSMEPGGAIVSTTTTQSDSAVSGTGTISGASVAHVAVSGMSDRPALNLTLADTAGELIFSGTYVTADSVVGSVNNGSGFLITFSLTRQ
jgi:hypothetical protein